MLKKIVLTTLLSAPLFFSATTHAGDWFGYINAFENNAGSAGNFVFGAAWGVSDLKTTVMVSNAGTYLGDQLLLQPNFNAYNGSDPFWSDGAGKGNKFLEANTYVEFPGIATPAASFSGTVDSYTLDSTYGALAFIKVLDPSNGWSLDVFEMADLSGVGSFSLSSDLTAHQGKVLQLGFLISGLNANPIDEAALGSVGVTVIPEPSTYALFGGLLVFGLAAWRRRAVRR